MAEKKSYRYFIEHKNAYTNQVLSDKLSPDYLCEPRTLWTGRVCPAWEVPDRRFVNFLLKSKQTLKIEFDAFIQENNKPLRPFPWPIAKRKGAPVKRNLGRTRNSK